MMKISAKQYETVELCFQGMVPEGSMVDVDISAVFSHEGSEILVRGFYAGEGIYKVRFLPEDSGVFSYTVNGSGLSEQVSGTLDVLPGDGKHHGPVRADGTYLKYADGTWFHSFGTTVYALAHQPEELIDETISSLSDSPFNKIRMCLFPKHYNYNFNEPQDYAFFPKKGAEPKSFPPEETPIFPQKLDARDDYWDVHHPNFAFWDRFEERMKQLQDMGIEIDLILFHPYDRWGFGNLTLEDNLTYLDYLLRRFSAFPGVWWSLANEYDLCFNKTMEDWYAIESFVAEHDPYHHLLGNHNWFPMWDAGREKITHISWQSKQHFRIAELMKRYGKPVLIDECRYEGTLPEFWGNISGREMIRAFWRVTAQGAYCTHGETFMPGTELGNKATHTDCPDVVWWAKGGILNGESPKRIAFLREIIEELPGPLKPMLMRQSAFLGMTDAEARETASQLFPLMAPTILDGQLKMDYRERDFHYAVQYEYAGNYGEEAFLWYLDDQCCSSRVLALPEEYHYRVELIDTWEMTREIALENASGSTQVTMPGKPFMAILAVRENI